MNINSGIKIISFIVGSVTSGILFAAVASSDFSVTPPNITDAADPFVMISLSVELTQQAEAYTDGGQTLVGGTLCPGHLSGVGICYTKTETYLGYFDPLKCYVYDKTGANTTTTQLATGPRLGVDAHYFRPVSYATDHECSGAQFSGNFMNWASMTALDEFRFAMTGGARLKDTSGANAQTLLTRTHRYGDWGFRQKAIASAGLTLSGQTFLTNPSDVTPFSELRLGIVNNDGHNANRLKFFDTLGGLIDEYNIIVEVCNPDVGLESNCVEYTDGTNTWYKPEGVMQNHSLEMRYALTSYSAQNGNSRNGGVLRSNAKYIGYQQPAVNGGLMINPNAEIDAQGLYVFNPDSVTIGSGVNNSGILNYINSFGLGPDRYKGNDPIAELYYESLRYIKNLGHTPEYSGASGSLSALTNNQKDNFPVITLWDDPVVNECQANYIIAVGDQFAHADNNLPGSTITGGPGIPYTPSNPDTSINVDTLTDRVGTLENFRPGTLGARTRGRSNNGWYLAGLAYHAATTDIRPSATMPGKQTVKTFIVDTQEYNGNPPTEEENPLWLAAKYGGFEDINGDGDPNNGTPRTSTDEWDADSDGVPDTYTLSSQPANLIKGLNAAFNDISERVSAGSSATVVTNSSSGEGAVYQGLYKPKVTKQNDRVEWVGILHALFVDEHGNFREDTDGDATLTDNDAVIEFEYDTVQLKTLVRRSDTTDGGATFTYGGAPLVEIEDLKTLWNARDQLASLTNLTSQRNYTDEVTPASGRHILTAIDGNADGIAVSTDLLDFDTTNFPASGGASNNFRYLGLDSVTGGQAPNIVNYIRGQEITGLRSRSIDYDGDGTKEVWRLGDIIHSSPVAVSRPQDRYDLTYNDSTYSGYREQYFDRRTVIYAGANDGMLHAFNGGFYSTSEKKFRTSPNGSTGITDHPLGSEMWSYIPYNLLPHLRWLTEVEYPHVYYVDGIPQVFDVNIFTPSPTHPDGWGTILVVGLNFGGGQITFDPDSDTDGDTSDDIQSRSSYIVLDITDPEQAPKLVAEISHPEMGFSTSRPALVKNRQPNTTSGTYASPAANEWALVFGSGPIGSDATTRRIALKDGVSNQQAQVFVFDLISKTFKDTATAGDTSFNVTTGASDGFTGDLTSSDWDRDFKDDVVYFGTVQGSVSAPEGELMRFVPGSNFNFSSASFSSVISKSGGLDQPFNGKPYVSTSPTGDHWIHAGTGRFYVVDDNLSSVQQSFYGVKEPVDSSGALTYASLSYTSDLVDTTGIEVFDDGSIRRSGSDPVLSNGDTVSTFSDLKASIGGEDGWYFNFDDTSARNVGRLGKINASIIFTEYVPSGDLCSPLGETFLNAVHFETGTAAPFVALQTGSTTYNSGTISERSVTFGLGLIRDVVIDSHGSRIIGQDSTGGLQIQDINLPNVPPGRMSWRQLEIQ